MTVEEIGNKIAMRADDPHSRDEKYRQEFAELLSMYSIISGIPIEDVIGTINEDLKGRNVFSLYDEIKERIAEMEKEKEEVAKEIKFPAGQEDMNPELKKRLAEVAYIRIESSASKDLVVDALNNKIEADGPMAVFKGLEKTTPDKQAENEKNAKKIMSEVNEFMKLGREGEHEINGFKFKLEKDGAGNYIPPNFNENGVYASLADPRKKEKSFLEKTWDGENLLGRTIGMDNWTKVGKLAEGKSALEIITDTDLLWEVAKGGYKAATILSIGASVGGMALPGLIGKGLSAIRTAKIAMTGLEALGTIHTAFDESLTTEEKKKSIYPKLVRAGAMSLTLLVSAGISHYLGTEAGSESVENVKKSLFGEHEEFRLQERAARLPDDLATKEATEAVEAGARMTSEQAAAAAADAKAASVRAIMDKFPGMSKEDIIKDLESLKDNPDLLKLVAEKRGIDPKEALAMLKGEAVQEIADKAADVVSKIPEGAKFFKATNIVDENGNVSEVKVYEKDGRFYSNEWGTRGGKLVDINGSTQEDLLKHAQKGRMDAGTVKWLTGKTAGTGIPASVPAGAGGSIPAEVVTKAREELMDQAATPNFQPSGIPTDPVITAEDKVLILESQHKDAVRELNGKYMGPLNEEQHEAFMREREELFYKQAQEMKAAKATAGIPSATERVASNMTDGFRANYTVGIKGEDVPLSGMSLKDLHAHFAKAGHGVPPEVQDYHIERAMKELVEKGAATAQTPEMDR